MRKPFEVVAFAFDHTHFSEKGKILMSLKSLVKYNGKTLFFDVTRVPRDLHLTSNGVEHLFEEALGLAGGNCDICGRLNYSLLVADGSKGLGEEDFP